MHGAFFSGLPLSLNTFLSIGNAILIVPALLYALLNGIAANSAGHAGQTGWAAAFASGAAAVWLVYWVGYGVAPWGHCAERDGAARRFGQSIPALHDMVGL